MNELESQIQKSIVSFCKFLPEHVDKWKAVLQQSSGRLRNLCNFSEQLLCVEDTNLLCFEDFKDSHKSLQGLILQNAEKDILELKVSIVELHQTNQDLKNKLFTLERLSQALPWEEDLVVIKGTGSQPRLERILQDGLSFFMFFSKTCENISEKFKKFNLQNEKSVKELEKAFAVDLDNKIVCNLLAITQYVDNEKAIL